MRTSSGVSEPGERNTTLPRPGRHLTRHVRRRCEAHGGPVDHNRWL